MRGTNESEALRGRRHRAGWRDQETYWKAWVVCQTFDNMTLQQAWNVGMTSPFLQKATQLVSLDQNPDPPAFELFLLENPILHEPRHVG